MLRRLKLLARKTRSQTRRLAEALLLKVSENLRRVEVLLARQLCLVHTPSCVPESTRASKLGARSSVTFGAGLRQAGHSGVDHVLLIRRHEPSDVLLELLRPESGGLLRSLRRRAKLLRTHTVSYGLLRDVKALLLHRTEAGDARPTVGLVGQL